MNAVHPDANESIAFGSMARVTPADQEPARPQRVPGNLPQPPKVKEAHASGVAAIPMLC